jgi:hypothetical protein
LERGHREHHHTQNEEIQEHQELRELESQEEDLLYSQRNQTFTSNIYFDLYLIKKVLMLFYLLLVEDEEDRPGYFSMNHNSVLSLGRSSVLEREEGSNSDHDQLVPQQVQPEQEEEQQDTKGAIVMNPNDSAIDLRTSVVLDQSDISATKTTDASCSLTITSSIANLSESLPSSPSVTTTTTSSSTTPMTKKKVSSWSPRRIFSSSSSSNSHNETANTKKISKKSSSASLNNTEEASTKPEKFHLSSLFSRKSNNNDKKKKKGTPDHSLDPNSPYLSSTETLLEKPKRVHQFNHTRLPIHTERAIYRLSHMKLTNPRRPLHDQVTISNLMFWYLSVVSQTTNSSAESEPNTAVPINAMTMKAYRMQIKHQQQKNSKNKRRVRHHNNNQVRPENSNAMDMFYQQQKNSQQQLYRQKRNVSAPTLGERPRYQKTHLRSSNSSSEDEDEEEESDDELSSSDELDSTRGLDSEDVFIKKSTKPTKKTKKYSLFSKSDKTTSWLPSFSSPKQHEVVSTREDEDDIPLAMYQKTKN